MTPPPQPTTPLSSQDLAHWRARVTDLQQRLESAENVRTARLAAAELDARERERRVASTLQSQVQALQQDLEERTSALRASNVSVRRLQRELKAAHKEAEAAIAQARASTSAAQNTASMEQAALTAALAHERERAYEEGRAAGRAIAAADAAADAEQQVAQSTEQIAQLRAQVSALEESLGLAMADAASARAAVVEQQQAALLAQQTSAAAPAASVLEDDTAAPPSPAMKALQAEVGLLRERLAATAQPAGLPGVPSQDHLATALAAARAAVAAAVAGLPGAAQRPASPSSTTSSSSSSSANSAGEPTRAALPGWLRQRSPVLPGWASSYALDLHASIFEECQGLTGQSEAQHIAELDALRAEHEAKTRQLREQVQAWQGRTEAWKLEVEKASRAAIAAAQGSAEEARQALAAAQAEARQHQSATAAAQRHVDQLTAAQATTAATLARVQQQLDELRAADRAATNVSAQVRTEARQPGNAEYVPHTPPGSPGLAAASAASTGSTSRLHSSATAAATRESPARTSRSPSPVQAHHTTADPAPRATRTASAPSSPGDLSAAAARLSADRVAQLVQGMSVSQLKKMLDGAGVPHGDCVEKSELQARLVAAAERGRRVAAERAHGDHSGANDAERTARSATAAAPSSSQARSAGVSEPGDNAGAHPARWAARLAQRYGAASSPSGSPKQAASASGASGFVPPQRTAPAEPSDPWRPAHTAEGAQYWYHVHTRETRWTKPVATPPRSAPSTPTTSPRVSRSASESAAAAAAKAATKARDDAVRESAEREVKAAVQRWSAHRGVHGMLATLPSVLKHVERVVPHEVLEAGRTRAEGSQLKKAYLKAVRLIHPDKVPQDHIRAQIEAHFVLAALNDAWAKWQATPTSTHTFTGHGFRASSFASRRTSAAAATAFWRS